MSDDESKTPGTPETDDADEDRPRITLDRYMGQRRRTSAWSWAHLMLLAFMLGALVMLLLYKDRCGHAVSSFIFMHSPDRGAAVAPPSPAHRTAPPSPGH